MVLTKINLNNIKIINKKDTIFHIQNIKLRISLFLYDYQDSILNNRLYLFKNDDYLDINNVNNPLLIEAEKLKKLEHRLLFYLQKIYFLQSNLAQQFYKKE